MANIALPSKIIIQSVSLEMSWPGQTVLASIYTDKKQTLTRGSGRFQGTVVFDVGDHYDLPVGAAAGGREQRAEMEAFLVATRGAGNTFTFPIQRDPRGDLRSPDDDPITVDAVNAGDTLFLTLAHFAPGTAALRGDYLSINSRLYICLTNMTADGVVAVGPEHPPDVGAAVEFGNVRILARRPTPQAVQSVVSGDWAGPWTVRYEEEVQ